MRRLTVGISVFMICLAGEIIAEAQNPPSQNYVVQYGDTLWDIAADQFNDPLLWREIHQNNPHIVNPNLIYPGDILGISPKIMGRRRSDKMIARPWYGTSAPQPEEIERPAPPNPIVPSAEFIEASGYIVPYTIEELTSKHFAQITGVQSREGEANSQIIHSEHGHLGLIFGDKIYINRGIDHNVREGDLLVAFRPVREVYHPLTSEIMGTQIDVLGRVRIETLEPGISCAEIVQSYDYMEFGNPVMPVSEMSIPLSKPKVGNSRSYGLQVGNQLIGHIVAERSPRQGIAFGDVVFLDVGAAQGVQPADHLIIFREIGEGFPKQAIGRVIVLSVQEQTSTALITESVKTINIGEKVVLKR
jgi:hypothetical protein